MPPPTEALKEIRFTYQHEGCWLQETTERHASILLVASSLYLSGDDVVMDLTAHAPDPATVEAALDEWREDPRIHRVDRLQVGARGTRFHVRYGSRHSIYRYILEHTPVSIGAIRFAQGTEHYQLMGSGSDLQQLVRTLGDKGRLVVRSVREADVSAPEGDSGYPGSPWELLTDKQAEAVIVAHAAGYYKWPRQASASALAKQVGLSSSAFLDHLRHAEARLLSSLVEMMREREAGRVESVLSRVPVPDDSA